MVYKSLVNGFNQGLNKRNKILFKIVLNAYGLVFIVWPLGFRDYGL